MTDRAALEDWLDRATTLTAPAAPCTICGQPATWETWRHNQPDNVEPVCQPHAAIRATTIQGRQAVWVVQLAGT